MMISPADGLKVLLITPSDDNYRGLKSMNDGSSLLPTTGQRRSSRKRIPVLDDALLLNADDIKKEEDDG